MEPHVSEFEFVYSLSWKGGEGISQLGLLEKVILSLVTLSRLELHMPVKTEQFVYIPWRSVELDIIQSVTFRITEFVGLSLLSTFQNNTSLYMFEPRSLYKCVLHLKTSRRRRQRRA
jgi:hypothetical protein